MFQYVTQFAGPVYPFDFIFQLAAMLTVIALSVFLINRRVEETVLSSYQKVVLFAAVMILSISSVAFLTLPESISGEVKYTAFFLFPQLVFVLYWVYIAKKAKQISRFMRVALLTQAFFLIIMVATLLSMSNNGIENYLR